MNRRLRRSSGQREAAYGSHLELALFRGGAFIMRPTWFVFRRALVRISAIFLCLIAAIATRTVSAQERDWPNRPVTIVYPWAPGATDASVRFIAKALSERFGQPFIVEIRSGAGGNVALAQVAKAAPDGYTIVFTAIGPAVLNKLMYQSIPTTSTGISIRSSSWRMLPSIISSPKLPIKRSRSLSRTGKRIRAN